MFAILRGCLAVSFLCALAICLRKHHNLCLITEHITLKSDKDFSCFMTQIIHDLFFITGRTRKPVCESHGGTSSQFHRKTSALMRCFLVLCRHCQWHLKKMSSDISTCQSSGHDGRHCQEPSNTVLPTHKGSHPVKDG